jgi:hypothetical protein
MSLKLLPQCAVRCSHSLIHPRNHVLINSLSTPRQAWCLSCYVVLQRPRPGGAARRGSQPGGSAGGGGQGEADLEEREEGGASGDFEDATEQWLSPASSFTTSGVLDIRYGQSRGCAG